jgi:DNA mismatch endonuclease (patch repair protein)
MAAIRGKDTRPEMLVRHAIHAAGLRYRLHRRDLPGSPDIVLTRLKSVVFIHGCFWHHHHCQKAKWPKTRAAFWRKKLEANVARDRRTRFFLKTAGWTVYVIWECEIAKGRALPEIVRALKDRRRRLASRSA